MNKVHHPRDPAALRRLLVTCVAVAILWQMMQLAQFDVLALFEDRNLKVFANFLVQFFPPNLQATFLMLVLKATIETLAMATAGIALALLIAVPLGLILSLIHI